LKSTKDAAPKVVTQETGKRKPIKKAPGKKPGALRYEIVD
jgi:hypothetical protein